MMRMTRTILFLKERTVAKKERVTLIVIVTLKTKVGDSERYDTM